MILTLISGGKERIFDDMNNGFGWNRLPKAALWGKGILCLRRFCFVRNVYNKMIFIALQAKSH